MLNILVVGNDYNTITSCLKAIRYILPVCFIHQTDTEEKAMSIINKYPFDLFIIDIEHPHMSGFQLADKIREELKYIFANIVFITENRENRLLLENNCHPYNYLKKPFSLTSFQASLGLLLKGLNNMKMQNLTTNLFEKEKYILIETKNYTKYIHYNEILFAEAENRGVNLITKNAFYSGIKLKLEAFHENADTDHFCRCHKSYVLNLANVIGVKNVSTRLWLADFCLPSSHECYISKTFYDQVITSLKNN